MNILLLDHDASRRLRIEEALAIVGREYAVHAVASVAEAEDALSFGKQPFSLALVGPDLPENPIPAVRFLRRLSPDTRIAAYDAYNQYDEVRLQRILLAGANMVFDIRMTALKIALLLRPLVTLAGSRAAPSMLAA